MDTIKILLAEDEPSLGMIIQEGLEFKNFDVTLCENGEIAYQKFNESKPDLLILDVMMPVMDGITLLKKIRETDTVTPAIFLTAKSQTKDVVDGFLSGGNDYLKKPFSMEELIVRVNSLLDRIKTKHNKEKLSLGKFIFNYKRQKIIDSDNIEIPLTSRESELLYHLLERKNEVLDRSFILKKIWGQDDFFTARSMDVFISKLRKKLKKDSTLEIVNIRGVGYKLMCE